MSNLYRIIIPVFKVLYPNKADFLAKTSLFLLLEEKGEFIEVEKTLFRSTKKARIRYEMTVILSLLAILVFMGSLFALFTNQINKESSEVAYLLLGTVVGLVNAVFAYYFGPLLGNRFNPNVELNKGVNKNE